MDGIRTHEIRQNNAGVSDARKLGVLKVKGEYLVFLDAIIVGIIFYLEYMVCACSQKSVNGAMCAEGHDPEYSI